MNIPPHQSLIVSAIYAQTAPRHFVLAAAAVTVLCGAASAQSAPAAPPLLLWSAVSIPASPAPGELLTLERSAGLQQWEAAAEPVFGSGAALTLLEPAEARADAGFFRLRTETRPAVGSARWSLAGCTMMLNRGATNCRLTFAEGGAGTMTAGESSLTFTWEWRRTGMDSGTVAMLWPDGSRVEQEFEFLSAAAGVFVARETAAGSDAPAGVSAGAFRMNPEEAQPSTAPQALENVRISFSGSGRATGLRIGAGNAMQRTTPFGTENCQIQYTRTGETTATLHLANSTMEQTIELTFTGPGCGVCLTRETRGGILRRESAGTFLLSPES